ncbi:MAG TPA: hypothetical protein VKU41_00270 [Polyangiaceae bacterium]|nr:hypothetical protein [Polyangiaceae bacterium]
MTSARLWLLAAIATAGCRGTNPSTPADYTKGPNYSSTPCVDNCGGNTSCVLNCTNSVSPYVSEPHTTEPGTFRPR